MVLRASPASLSALIVATVAGALAIVPSAAAQSRGAAASPAEPKPFLDVRDAQRRAVERRGDVSLRGARAGTRSARARLRSPRARSSRSTR